MKGEKSIMMRKISCGITALLSLTCFISFLLWFFGDNYTAKIIFLVAFALQLYGIFTAKKS